MVLPVFGLDVDDNIVNIYDGRLSSNAGTGNLIGEARVYTFGSRRRTLR